MKLKTCDRCSTEYPEDVASCPNCQTQASQSDAESNTEQRAVSGGKKGNWGSALFVFLLIFVIGFLAKNGITQRKEQEKAQQAEIQQSVEASMAASAMETVNNDLAAISMRHQRLDRLAQIVLKKLNRESVPPADDIIVTQEPLFKNAFLPKDQFPILAREYRKIIDEYHALKKNAHSINGIGGLGDFDRSVDDNIKNAQHNLNLINEILKQMGVRLR